MLEPDTVMVRYDEIGVKSKQVRRKMEALLEKNIENLLQDREIGGEVNRAWSRLFIETEEPDRASKAAKDAFGVASASPAVKVAPEKGEIVERVVELAQEKYNKGSFAVRARRAGDKEAHDFTSQELDRDVGQAVADSIDSFKPEVDLDSPDITFYIECRQDQAYLFTEKMEGPGGLPLGTQKKLAALISGGYDSPVAAWEVMKRGAEVVPVYFDLGKYGGPDHRARVTEIVETLQRYAPERDMRIRRVPIGDHMEKLMEETDKTRMLHYRRLMYRTAEIIAEKEGCRGLVTGESIGQKSSQTVSNLGVASEVVDLPVHRPLLSMDKKDIVERAKEIGTHKGSKIPAGCVQIAPDYPETHAELEEIEEKEPEGLFEWAENAAENVDIQEV
ncbi:MAG: tRNA uracil 4-sulfurtransferase ThiI [Candidatus Nanohaloarchaea archaeon]|nr:tRNA uracil 4-sulfurtransferase ThiI [Candidatus Nanohaloarchaea archaeon]